jgi:hypothetical protein
MSKAWRDKTMVRSLMGVSSGKSIYDINEPLIILLKCIPGNSFWRYEFTEEVKCNSR